MPTTGRNALLGIGFETVAWGTVATPTVFKRITSITPSRDRQKVQTPDLGFADDNNTLTRETYVAQDDAGVQFVCPMYYDDPTVALFESIMGKVATTGTGPYTHTFSLEMSRTSAYTADPLTLEVKSGTPPNSGGADSAEQFEGCLPQTATFSWERGSPASLSASYVAETSGGKDTPTAATLAGSPDLILFSDVAAPTYNARTICARSISITVDRALGERRCLNGTALIDQPVEEGVMSVQAEIQMEYDAAAKLLHDDYLADVRSDLVIANTGRGNNSATFTLEDAEILSFSHPTNSRGVLLCTVVFRATRQSTATYNGFGIVVTNDNATART